MVTLDRMEPDDGDDYYFSGEYLQDILEFWLAELGGEELVRAAQVEAAAHVVNSCPPWDGAGDEPAELVSAFCAGLWLAIERHQVTRTARVRPGDVMRSRRRRRG